MSSSSQQGNGQPSHGGNSVTKQEPLYMLHEYANADPTVIERISGAVKGGQSSSARYKEHVSRAKREIEKFDNSFGGK